MWPGLERMEKQLPCPVDKREPLKAFERETLGQNWSSGDALVWYRQVKRSIRGGWRKGDQLGGCLQLSTSEIHTRDRAKLRFRGAA